MVMVAAGAAAAAALIWYLVRPEPEKGSKEPAAKKSAAPPKETKEETKRESERVKTVQVLHDIIDSQTNMKDLMQKMVKDIIANPSMTFKQVYAKVEPQFPVDPLLKRGMDVAVLDSLLDEFQKDAEVEPLLKLIMNQTAGQDEPPPETVAPMNKLTEIHVFMLQTLKDLRKEAATWAKKGDKRPDLMTACGQMIVAAKTESKYNYNAQQIEGGIAKEHQALQHNAEFFKIHQEMQAVMSEISSV